MVVRFLYYELLSVNDLALPPPLGGADPRGAAPHTREPVRATRTPARTEPGVAAADARRAGRRRPRDAQPRLRPSPAAGVRADRARPQARSALRTPGGSVAARRARGRRPAQVVDRGPARPRPRAPV